MESHIEWVARMRAMYPGGPKPEVPEEPRHWSERTETQPAEPEQSLAEKAIELCRAERKKRPVVKIRRLTREEWRDEWKAAWRRSGPRPRQWWSAAVGAWVDGVQPRESLDGDGREEDNGDWDWWQDWGRDGSALHARA